MAASKIVLWYTQTRIKPPHTQLGMGGSKKGWVVSKSENY